MMGGDGATAASTSASVIYRRAYSSRDLYSFLSLGFILSTGSFGLVLLSLGAGLVATVIWGVACLGLSTLLLLSILRGEHNWVTVDQENLRWGNSKREDRLRLNQIKRIHLHRLIGLEIEVIEGGRSVLKYPYIRHYKPLIDAMVQANPDIEIIRYADADGGSF
ncbi:MAG: hypothetical protein AAGC72_04270 [Planctomycetota bacterium]